MGARQLRQLALYCLIGIAMLSLTPAQAETTDPVGLLKAASDQMFASLNQKRTELQNNPVKTQELIEQILMPHLDFITASRWVLGKHWRRANKEQKLNFIRQFRNLLLRFYSTALSEYLSETKRKSFDPNSMKFFPLRANKGDTDVTVRSEFIPGSGKPVPVHYHMHQTKKGWKIYDISVEGISVITTYRTSFGSEIQQNGLDSLINSLSDKNNKFLAQAPKAKTTSEQ